MTTLLQLGVYQFIEYRYNRLTITRPCGQLKRTLEEMKRLGFFKNAYRNVRKAYFDGRTTQREFCFETNILCNRRLVQWRTMKFKMRKTALQNKRALNNYSLIK